MKFRPDGFLIFGSAISLAFLGVAPPSSAGNAEALFLRNRAATHLPADTTTLVLVDLDRCRSADPSIRHRWFGVIADGIARRFEIEKLRLSLDEDVASLLYFELPTEIKGGPPAGGWLVNRKSDLEPAGRITGNVASTPTKESVNLAEGTNYRREFDDGSFAVGAGDVLARLSPSSRPPVALMELFDRVDPGSAVSGASRESIRLPFHTIDGITHRALPGEAFALHVELDRGLRFAGSIFSASPLAESDGRLFVRTMIDFFQPAGSFGPGGIEVAKSAKIEVLGDSLRIDVTIPRESLVAFGSSEGRWTSAPDPREMTTPRGGQAAALLSDGTVVFAGGFDGQRGLASVEIFDPVSNRFLADRLQLSGRRVAAAFALAAGDRLFLFYGMDGLYESVELPSADELDLRSGRTERFAVPKGPGRIGATATLLGDGRILIAGGIVTPDSGAPDAYIFDPDTKQFDSVEGNMSVPRGDHAAVRLLDGRVLFAGGAADRKATAALEIFDPANRRFESLSEQLPSPRSGLAGSLLPDGRVVLAGGFDSSGALDDILLWNPADHSLRAAGKLKESRYFFPAITLSGGEVLFTGGGIGKLAMRKSAEIWKPAVVTSRPILPISSVGKP